MRQQHQSEFLQALIGVLIVVFDSSCSGAAVCIAIIAYNGYAKLLSVAIVAVFSVVYNRQVTCIYPAI